MLTQYIYDNSLEFTFENAEISASKAQLSLVDKAGETFSQAFTNDTGFTYDSSLAEFNSGLVRQVNKTPSNSILGATFTSSLNLSWFPTGSTAVTLNGTPTNTGGKLVCTGAQGAYYSYTTSAIETYKFKHTPNYSGGPVANVNLMSSYNGSNNNNRFFLMHSGAGSLRITLDNSSGSSVLPLTPIGSWTNVAGTEYEFEIVLNSTAGTIRLFIDGVLKGTLSPGAWTRGSTSSRLYLGASPSAYNLAEGSFDDFLVFTNAQHTASYTPGYTVPETVYSTSVVQLPNFSYSGLGAVQALTNITSTEVGSPRYVIEGQYWNGSSWAASDNSYAQSNSIATVLTNIASLDVSGETEVSVNIVFGASNTLSSVDLLTITYTGQKYASLGSVLTNDPIISKELLTFVSEFDEPSANSRVRFVMVLEDVDMYWNGAAWVTSNATEAQSNTLADVQANIATFIEDNSNVKLKVLLIADTDTETPKITSSTFTYIFGSIAPADPTKCNVYGFITTVEGIPIENATINIKPSVDSSLYREASNRLIGYQLTRTSDDEGFFSFNLIRSSEFENSDFKYTMDITFPDETSMTVNGTSTIDFSVPDLAEANITSLITAG